MKHTGRDELHGVREYQVHATQGEDRVEIEEVDAVDEGNLTRERSGNHFRELFWRNMEGCCLGTDVEVKVEVKLTDFTSTRSDLELHAICDKSECDLG